jgi:hypothetical protein
MIVYAVGFDEVDFGGRDIVQHHGVFLRREDCEERVRQLNDPPNMWGTFFVAEMEVR